MWDRQLLGVPLLDRRGDSSVTARRSPCPLNITILAGFAFGAAPLLAYFGCSLLRWVWLVVICATWCIPVGYEVAWREVMRKEIRYTPAGVEQLAGERFNSWKTNRMTMLPDRLRKFRNLIQFVAMYGPPILVPRVFLPRHVPLWAFVAATTIVYAIAYPQTQQHLYSHVLMAHLGRKSQPGRIFGFLWLRGFPAFEAFGNQLDYLCEWAKDKAGYSIGMAIFELRNIVRGRLLEHICKVGQDLRSLVDVAWGWYVYWDGFSKEPTERFFAYLADPEKAAPEEFLGSKFYHRMKKTEAARRGNADRDTQKSPRDRQQVEDSAGVCAAPCTSSSTSRATTPLISIVGGGGQVASNDAADPIWRARFRYSLRVFACFFRELFGCADRTWVDRPPAPTYAMWRWTGGTHEPIFNSKFHERWRWNLVRKRGRVRFLLLTTRWLCICVIANLLGVTPVLASFDFAVWGSWGSALIDNTALDILILYLIVAAACKQFYVGAYQKTWIRCCLRKHLASRCPPRIVYDVDGWVRSEAGLVLGVALFVASWYSWLWQHLQRPLVNAAVAYGTSTNLKTLAAFVVEGMVGSSVWSSFLLWVGANVVRGFLFERLQYTCYFDSSDVKTLQRNRDREKLNSEKRRLAEADAQNYRKKAITREIENFRSWKKTHTQLTSANGVHTRIRNLARMVRMKETDADFVESRRRHVVNFFDDFRAGRIEIKDFGRYGRLPPRCKRLPPEVAQQRKEERKKRIQKKIRSLVRPTVKKRQGWSNKTPKETDDAAKNTYILPWNTLSWMRQRRRVRNARDRILWSNGLAREGSDTRYKLSNYALSVTQLSWVLWCLGI